jgi:hypothetical protein
MISELQELSAEERQLMYDAPILVSVLIAGADDNIDAREIRRAIKIAEEKAQNLKAHIIEFYVGVSEDFDVKLADKIRQYPSSAVDRTPLLSKHIARLNPILSKIDKTFAIVYHHSLREISRTIAKSSGGLLGINAIGEEEAELIELPMLKDPSIMFGG